MTGSHICLGINDWGVNFYGSHYRLRHWHGISPSKRHYRHRNSSSSGSSTDSPLISCVSTPARRMVKKIKRGEYTDFDKWLSPTDDAVPGQAVAPKKSRKTKRQLCDLQSWLEVWNIYEKCTKGAEWHYAHKCWGPACGGDHPLQPALVPSWHPRQLPRPHTPLQSSTFEQELRNHPNKAWISWLLSGIDNGVSTGYNGPRFSHNARNLASALKHPAIIDA